MNTLWMVVIAVLVIYVAYSYARRVDRNVIRADAKRATPAKMYMDGVDFMPTSKNVLYGYHFKSIAAAGPIVGPITAANIWGWGPSLLWLVIGVSLIGWASDYSAIMVAVRNDGNSLSAISHKLIAPRTRRILFVFIFFYLMLLAGAFVGILAAILSARPDVPFGIIMLALMGLLAGQMMYRWKMDLFLVTAIVVVATIAAMALGPWGQHKDDKGKLVQGPIGSAIVSLNASVDNLSGKQPLMSLADPTNADPRIPVPGPDGKRPTTAAYDAATSQVKTLPNYLLWMAFLFVFSYCGANMPIWRFAQPVNYIGFWIMLITIVLSAVGMFVAPLTGVKDLAGNAIGAFSLTAVKDLGFAWPLAGKAWQPLWPMLFVTIACGAISGWHALVGSVGTARQLEYETDCLPVGAGSMLGEYSLALLSLTAVSIAGVGGGGGRFAAGVGKLIFAGTFGIIPEVLGTALGFGAFVMIVLTVTQLVFRVMRVTLAEWMGDTVPLFRNMHVVQHHLDGAHGRARPHGDVGLSLADVRRLEPAHGRALAPRRDRVAEVRGKEPELRALPDALHVLHDARRDVRHGTQPLRDHRREPRHERAPGGGRVGHDHRRRPAARGFARHRVGWPEGLPQVFRAAPGEAGDRLARRASACASGQRLAALSQLAERADRPEEPRGVAGRRGKVHVELEVRLVAPHGEPAHRHPRRSAPPARGRRPARGLRRSA